MNFRQAKLINTINEARLALKNGFKVKHRFFFADEYFEETDGVIYDEAGMPYPQSWWDIRDNHDDWNKDWSLFIPEGTCRLCGGQGKPSEGFGNAYLHNSNGSQTILPGQGNLIKCTRCVDCGNSWEAK